MVKVSDTVSIRKIEHEIFIYDRQLSMIHSFNKTGSFIWDLLVENVDSGEIPNRICDRFEIDRETAERDTGEFIQELARKKLLWIQ
jgi:hypothetical protein